MNQTTDKPVNSTDGKYQPLRVWPAVLLLFGVAILKLLPSFVENESMGFLMITILGPLALGFLILIWWITFSRATWKERLIGFLGVLLCGTIVVMLSDKTMMGPGVVLIGIPLGTVAFGIAAVLMSRVLSFKRTLVAILAATCGIGFIALLRNDGMWGNGQLGLDWRWKPSPEEQMLAARDTQPKESVVNFPDPEIESWIENSSWPQFRGANADSRAMGPVVSSEWPAEGLRQIWKVPVGPGWSSFAVAGELLFTQEQHGDLESVVCYSASTGKEIWKQQISARFFDALGGPGPRATPTISDGKLFVQGAMGTIQRLDPKSGDVIWAKDLQDVAGRTPPVWGFPSSPVVADANVIVFAGGEGDKGVLAFDVESGKLNWSSRCGTDSYSTPQLVTLNDQEVVMMLTNRGLSVLDPSTGAELLDYQWKHTGYRAIQPQVVDGNSILLPTQEIGTRRILVTANESGLMAKDEWTSRQFRPDFNDFVVYEKHAYGFDGRFFACIDLDSGKRKWKGGRYGKGQVLLLVDSGLLLVMSESGEVLLVNATPKSHQELAKFQALEGRTWNHPVVIGDRLYVRNSQEAACFELPIVAAN